MNYIIENGITRLSDYKQHREAGMPAVNHKLARHVNIDVEYVKRSRIAYHSTTSQRGDSAASSRRTGRRACRNGRRHLTGLYRQRRFRAPGALAPRLDSLDLRGNGTLPLGPSGAHARAAGLCDTCNLIVCARLVDRDAGGRTPSAVPRGPNRHGTESQFVVVVVVVVVLIRSRRQDGRDVRHLDVLSQVFVGVDSYGGLATTAKRRLTGETLEGERADFEACRRGVYQLGQGHLV